MPTKKMKNSPDREVAVLEQPRLDEGPVGREHVRQEHVEKQAGRHRLDHDLGRREPVLGLAAVEHQLQGADGEAEQGEPEEVERAVPVAQRLRHEGRSEEHTSELQSLMRISYAVFCLKKKKTQNITKKKDPDVDTNK